MDKLAVEVESRFSPWPESSQLVTSFGSFSSLSCFLAVVVTSLSWSALAWSSSSYMQLYYLDWEKTQVFSLHLWLLHIAATCNGQRSQVTQTLSATHTLLLWLTHPTTQRLTPSPWWSLVWSLLLRRSWLSEVRARSRARRSKCLKLLLPSRMKKREIS